MTDKRGGPLQKPLPVTKKKPAKKRRVRAPLREEYPGCRSWKTVKPGVLVRRCDLNGIVELTFERGSATFHDVNHARIALRVALALCEDA